MSHEEQAALVAFAEKHQLLLICDEVYRFLEYQPERRLPAIADIYDLGVSIGSLSKYLGLPGLRTGWIATQQKTIQEYLVSYKSRTTLCNSVVTQYLACQAIQQKNRIMTETRERTFKHYALMEDFMRRHDEHFQWISPQAGTVGFIHLKQSLDADLFCDKLLDVAKVLCLPGKLFSYHSQYFRIGFGKSDFPDALAAMSAACAQVFAR